MMLPTAATSLIYRETNGMDVPQERFVELMSQQHHGPTTILKQWI